MECANDTEHTFILYLWVQHRAWGPIADNTHCHLSADFSCKYGAAKPAITSYRLSPPLASLTSG